MTRWDRITISEHGGGRFPLTPTLSLGERERTIRRRKKASVPACLPALSAGFPLPEREGQGEGEGDTTGRAA